MAVFSPDGLDLYATSFNTDQSCFTQDVINFTFSCDDIGAFPANDPAGFEGLKDLAFTQNGAFVAVFAVSSAFAAGTVAANGDLVVVESNQPTGVDPERAVTFGNQVFVANGFGNSIQVIDVAQNGTATASAEIPLPAGSNPRDIAVEDQIDAITQMYVANLSAGTVIEFNLGGALPAQGQTFTIAP
jgi:YVTN family beta-propeller protein